MPTGWRERWTFSAALAVALLPLPSARAHSLLLSRSDRCRELKKGIKHRVLPALTVCQGRLHQVCAQEHRGLDGCN